MGKGVMVEQDVASQGTGALKSIVGEDVAAALRGAKAMAMHPTAAGGPGVNLYLFQLGVSGASRREPLGIRLTDALPDAQPQPLDLWYLLSGHGDAQSSEPQQCLLAAVQALEKHPVLTAAELGAGKGKEAPAFGKVTVEMERFGLDQICNLWIALQARLAPSVIYKVSVELLAEPEGR